MNEKNFPTTEGVKATDGLGASPDSTIIGSDAESGVLISAPGVSREAELFQLKQEKLRKLREKEELIDKLPHQHGFKKYKWQREFFECERPEAFLTAANQIGKSTINIATAIEWATNKALWPKLFKRRKPRQFWYLYPSLDFATTEFEEKWKPDLMPRYPEDHPVYGWKVSYIGNFIHSIRFNTGVTIYFKAYTQKVSNLQGSTIDAVFCDEELPEEFWDEINWRRMAVGGYFRMVFTATLGQEIWYDTMERQGQTLEKFPGAKKWQISLYDCMNFEDGTPSHIDEEYINRAISLCKTETEVKKRVMGRFAQDSGLIYPMFSQLENVMPHRPIPRSWPVYIGVDIGGGGDGHPSAIVLTAVSPDYTEAEIFDGWMGDDELTTQQDVLDKVGEICDTIRLDPDRIAGIFYDYAAKDFGTLATQQGIAVEKADKSHATGEAVMGVLFKLRRLKVHNVPQLAQLIVQLCNLKRETPKKHAKDDFVDGGRYSVSRVPFDWKALGVKIIAQAKAVKPPNEEELAQRKRREYYLKEDKDQIIDIETEMAAWSELHEF